MSKRTTNAELAQLGGRLRALREDLGLTQSEIAQRLGLTDGGYGHFERGRRLPSAAELPWLANGFRVSVEELLARLGFVDQVPISGATSASPVPQPLAGPMIGILNGWSHWGQLDRQLVVKLLRMASKVGDSDPDTMEQSGSLDDVEQNQTLSSRNKQQTVLAL